MKTQLPSCLCALNTKLPDPLSCKLLTAHSFLKRSLRTLSRAFKPSLTHPRSGATLLAQHVSLQLLFRYSLTRAAKRTRADGLRAKPLPRDLTLPSNILQGLLHGSVFKLVHERACRRRVKHPPCLRQPAHAHQGCETRVLCALESLLLPRSYRSLSVLCALESLLLPRSNSTWDLSRQS